MKTNITFALILSMALMKVLCTVQQSRDTVDDHGSPRTDISEYLYLWEQQLRS